MATGAGPYGYSGEGGGSGGRGAGRGVQSAPVAGRWAGSRPRRCRLPAGEGAGGRWAHSLMPGSERMPHKAGGLRLTAPLRMRAFTPHSPTHTPRPRPPGLDIPNLHPNVDFFNLMTYDFHGSWDQAVNFQTPWTDAQVLQQCWVLLQQHLLLLPRGLPPDVALGLGCRRRAALLCRQRGRPGTPLSARPGSRTEPAPPAPPAPPRSALSLPAAGRHPRHPDRSGPLHPRRRHPALQDLPRTRHLRPLLDAGRPRPLRHRRARLRPRQRRPLHRWAGGRRERRDSARRRAARERLAFVCISCAWPAGTSCSPGPPAPCTNQ